jgi:EAL domain-containing protein (putative c-di-GMP-specific phosphodiesterase class I)/GGDEF domain-containing protein
MLDNQGDESAAGRDRLTGLPELGAVRARLGEWLTQASAAGQAPSVHVLQLGLRRFDAVNTAFGPAAGDAALVEVALRLSHFAASELDGAWIAGRISGGHFLLAACGAFSRERWQLFAGQLADRIAVPIPTPSGMARLTPRLGLLRALAGEEPDSVIDRLGQTLGRLTRQQGRRIAWADGEIVPPGTTSAQMETDLLEAIDRDEIEVVFQPQFALPGDGLSGAEALARWRHPRLGRIGAGALFSIAERSDHLVPLSRHIARRSLELARDWPAHLRLSLNVTPSDLSAGSYGDQLLAMLDETRFPAARLTLEVTEQTLLHDVAAAAPMLGELTTAGVRIALDDFGAGFCNFRYLKLLPLHYLKLDRSMVDGIADDPRDLAVFRAIMAMAHALDLQVIAEGIESEAQRDMIAAEGCTFYQGFFKAQPMSAAEFAVLAAGS